MDQSSASDGGGDTSYDALASLLGVKAQLRLVPHPENTPKAHIVLKRDYPKGQDESEESSARVARFSFIAGKKFTVAKGAHLYFSVASPSDRDGKTLLCDEKTFMIEADIMDASEEINEEDVESPEVEQSNRKRRKNVEGLPPKMRKSFSRKTTYESFIEKEPPTFLGFEGYPLSAPTPHVYSTAAVQTDLPLPPTSTPLEATATPRVSLSIVEHSDKSPFQLPSPVSADHAREPICLAPLEGEETDDFSREERSLSPMELSSASCSPTGSPARIAITLPDEPLPEETVPVEIIPAKLSPEEPSKGAPLPAKPPPEEPLPETPLPEKAEEPLPDEPAFMVCDTPSVDPPVTPSPKAPILSAPSSMLVVPEESTPTVEPVEPIPLEVLPQPTPLSSIRPQPPSLDVVSEPPTRKRYATPTFTSARQESVQDILIKKELVLESMERQSSMASSSTSWPSWRSMESDGIPIAPRAMDLVYRQQRSGGISARAQEKAPAVAPAPTSAQASFPTPISMKTSSHSSQTRTSSPPPDPKALVYIPSGSSSNPLGIRPSSGLGTHAVQKCLPKGPRSLLGPPTPTPTIATAKKPVVVGAKWSAARNSALSSNASNGGLSASSSSSSLTPIPSSPALPALSAPVSLSQILRYDSPSPPPPPKSDPPPPLPPQSGVTKWKRISSVVEKAPGRVAQSKSKSPEEVSDTTGQLATSTAAQKKADVQKLSGRAFLLATGHQLTPNGWVQKPSLDLIDRISVDTNVAAPAQKTSSTPDLIDRIALDTSVTGRKGKSSSRSITPSSSTSGISLKRLHETSAKPPVGPGGQTTKKAKNSPPPLLTTATATATATTATSASSISSLASSKAITGTTATPSVKPQPAPAPVSPSSLKFSQPLIHPLPPKPQLAKAATGSSYRPPAKRDRSPEPPEVKRTLLPRNDWPSTSPSAEYQLQTPDRQMLLTIHKIIFNSDGSRIALVCADRTLRIWENKQPAAEVARLTHNSAIASACWMQGDAGVMTLTVDGMVSTWTRNGKEWQFSKLLMIPDVAFLDHPANASLVYAKDRIAVTIPSGVKVWLLINNTWQPQRDIVRSGVTMIRFVQDGNALVGGCRDGVLWYCEVPNGTLRVHAFLSMKPINSIDIHPTGLYLLVGQEGGKCHLVTLKLGENKGTVERTYTSEKLQSLNKKGFPAVFATKGQAVLYGLVNACGLVWDRKKGTIVYGLKHPEGDPIQAAATFDGRPGVEGLMVTGTKQGRLFWWPQPVAAAPTHSSASSNADESQRKRQKLGS
ncbi:hypothetical protein GALMADRAFT_240187 [Galerina marginata CBS 339.88]|uniref:Uncharacterized protein n=1 Tax=Galerina marginata (strain CBS 339.88) TaxID=685588 RepID=A0A067THT4_GALM3|nr:hypothetical protein GALMADRAFT_240187 [Galerina marginata CBS 339.88]